MGGSVSCVCNTTKSENADLSIVPKIPASVPADPVVNSSQCSEQGDEEVDCYLSTKSRSIKSFANEKHDTQVNEYIRIEDIKFADGNIASPVVPPLLLMESTVQAEESNAPCDRTKPAFNKKIKLTLELDNDSAWVGTDTDDESRQFNSERQTSYKMTKSGTVFADGFEEGIGQHGIGRDSSHGMESKVTMKERIVVVCRLGAGCGGVVYKALDLSPLRLVALKVVPVHDRDKRHQIVREVSALYNMLSPDKSISHAQPCRSRVVDFYDAFSNVDDGGIALMMEYMDGGSLQDIVEKGGCSDEGVLASIASQTLEGLLFLHQHQHIHRDIKPANVLIDRNGAVKISDFGILRQVDPEKDRNHEVATFVGTSAYMAPERIDGGVYSYPCDIWAFGLTLLTLSLGQLPINVAGGFWSILESVRDNPPPSLPSEGKWSPEYRDFLSKCLVRDPAARCTAAQLLRHPFLKRVTEDEAVVALEEKGTKELDDILESLYTHLCDIRKHASRQESKSPHSTVDRDIETCDADGETVNVTEDKVLLSVKDMMRLVLFGSTGGDCSTPNERNEIIAPVGVMPKFISYIISCDVSPDRPRLYELARQLHLPLSRVIAFTESKLADMCR